MDDELKDDLTSISGVGEATAEKIMAVVDTPEGDVEENVSEAIAYLEAGRPGYALKYLKRIE